MTDGLAQEIGFTPSEVVQVPNRRHNDMVYQFAYSIFQDEFNQIRELTPESPHFTLLFDSVLNQAFDSNFLRAQEYTTKEGGELLRAQPAPMLNRNGWIHLVETQGTDNYDYFQFDIANFRQADLAGSADYLLNLIAGELNGIMQGFNQNRHIKDMGLVGRYGGDEFVLAMPKARSPEAQALLANIQAQIESLQGYYQNTDNRIEPANVRLKKEGDQPAIKKYEVKNDPTSQNIFKTYLSRGVLLDQAEIDKIMRQFEGKPAELEQFLADYKYDPDKLYGSKENLSEEAKIAFLIAKSQDFKSAFLLTDYLDDLSKERGEQAEDRPSRTQSLIKFIEGAVFDRLLGDIFSSYGVIKDGLLANEYEQLFSIDTKLLKEINTRDSYGDGDVMVRSVWEKISQCLGDKRQHFEIARRGGTYILTLKKGAQVSDSDLQPLRDLHEVEITLLNGRKLKMPIGFSELKCTDAPTDYTKQKAWLDEQFTLTQQAGQSWLTKILNYKTTNELPGEYLYKALIQPEAADDLGELLTLYFADKNRYQERIQSLEAIMREKKIYHNQLLAKLRELEDQGDLARISTRLAIPA